MREPMTAQRLTGRNKLGRLAWHLVWLTLYRPSPTPLHAWRRWLLRLFGAHIAAGAHPYPSARIWAPWNLRMGRNAHPPAGLILSIRLHARDHQALLGAGEGVDFDYRSKILQQLRLGNEEIASWRHGQLVFRDRPLVQLLDELSHYRAAPVRLAQASLGERRLSGSLNIAKPDDFLAALPQLLPVRVEHRGDGAVLIHPL